MVETNANATEFSFIARAREFLERGDLAAAVECYEKAFDPDALDEIEARNMLIEARAHLSRKHLFEAQECFEEALVMGTDVQRRQALDAITNIAEIRSRLVGLTARLRKGLKGVTTKRGHTPPPMAFVSDSENVVLISREALGGLPVNLSRNSRLGRLPQHLVDQPLPFEAGKCIPFTDEDDIRFILELAAALTTSAQSEQPYSPA
jgi:hypothetical protein